jgi:DNA-binding FadR family transcriptional regulator
VTRDATPVESTADDRGLSAFRPVRLRSAADEVVAVLADAIRGGLYQPGDLLPRERELAARIGVSRTVLREAVAILRREGVVSVRRGPAGGIMVDSLAPLGSVLAGLRSETHVSLRSLLEARRGVDLTAGLMFGERATESDLHELEQLVDALEAPLALADDDEFYAVDLRFHIRVVDSAGNEMLSAFERMLWRQMDVIRSQFPVGHVELGRAMENQRVTLRALQTRSPERIVAALDEHLAALEEHFLGERLTYVVVPSPIAAS